jgi:hypothetical protein
MKKFLATIIFSVIAVAYSLPVFAQTAGAAEPPYECWPQDLCKGNWAQTTESKKSCGTFEKSYGKPLGFCYAKPPQVNLQVSIGGANTVAGLTDYIPRVYNYLLGIVSIVAIIMIMVGGLRYLTAGGNTSAISSAKETIFGAIIGLFLTFGSFILLQTINPALTQLKLPDIKTIRTVALTNAGSECPADSPQKTSKVVLSNCSNNCDCFQGQTCEPVEESLIISASKLVVWSATAVAGGAIVGAGSVAAGGRYIIKGAYDLLKPLASKLAKFIVKNPIEVAGGATAYMVVNSLGGSPGAANQSVTNGICVQLAKNSIPAGGLCAFNSNCISGKCLDITTQKELTEEKLGEIGACVGDSKVFEGTLECKTNSDCVANAGPTTDVECVGGYCSWGNKGNTCCETGINPPDAGGSYICTDEWKCKETGTACAFKVGEKWYPTGADYSSTGCQTNLEFCKAYLTTYAGSKGACVDKNWIK